MFNPHALASVDGFPSWSSHSIPGNTGRAGRSVPEHTFMLSSSRFPRVGRLLPHGAIVAVAGSLGFSPGSWARQDLGVWKEMFIHLFCVLGVLGPGVPHIISTKLLKQFSCLTYNDGRLGLAPWGLCLSMAMQVRGGLQLPICGGGGGSGAK